MCRSHWRNDGCLSWGTTVCFNNLQAYFIWIQTENPTTGSFSNFWLPEINAQTQPLRLCRALVTWPDIRPYFFVLCIRDLLTEARLLIWSFSTPLSHLIPHLHHLPSNPSYLPLHVWTQFVTTDQYETLSLFSPEKHLQQSCLGLLTTNQYTGIHAQHIS